MSSRGASAWPPLLLVHARQAENRQLVERPLRRIGEPVPLGTDRADGVVVRQPDVRPLVVEILLHLPDDRTPLVLVRRQLLLRVHTVVPLVAVARVAPATVLRTRHDREHEV